MPPREMLTRLVAFDTTSALSNLPFIDFVRDYLDTYGIASQLTTDDTGNKANLFATVGPADRGGVVLSGHSDVVPVAGQEWHSDPFAVAEREGRLHGRGTADMKGFIAIALALVPEMVARRDQLEIPVHLAISYDEEVGCIGVRRLIDGLIGPRPRLVVVGEPTDLQVIDTHKGIDAFQTRIRGRAAHSSAPELGASAIALAGEIVQFIYRLSAELRDATTTPAFDPPYTTMNVGTISGGTAVNIIAQDCTLQWEYRALPGVDPAAIETRVRGFIADELLPRARAHCPEVEIVTERQSGVPAFSAVPGSPACSLALDLCQATDTGAVCFATEAGLFEAAGMPSVVWGPGSISEAHRPDEHITVAQFERGTEMIQRIIAWAQDPRAAALTG